MKAQEQGKWGTTLAVGGLAATGIAALTPMVVYRMSDHLGKLGIINDRLDKQAGTILGLRNQLSNSIAVAQDWIAEDEQLAADNATKQKVLQMRTYVVKWQKILVALDTLLGAMAE